MDSTLAIVIAAGGSRFRWLVGGAIFVTLAIIVRVADPFYCAWMWLRERRKKPPDENAR